MAGLYVGQDSSADTCMLPNLSGSDHDSISERPDMKIKVELKKELVVGYPGSDTVFILKPSFHMILDNRYDR